jgi:hypothetical protein
MTGKSQRNASFESRRRYRSTINESVETLQSLLQRYEQSVAKLQELVGNVKQRIEGRAMVRSDFDADNTADARANARQLAPGKRMQNTTGTRTSVDPKTGIKTSQYNAAMKPAPGVKGVSGNANGIPDHMRYGVHNNKYSARTDVKDDIDDVDLTFSPRRK